MNGHRFDLEDRTFAFAQKVREFVKKLPATLSNKPDAVQLIRASGSVGANFIEANEAVSREDFIYRAKVCRKETKESTYWLRLVDLEGMSHLESERTLLINESVELVKIFGSIIRKSELKQTAA